MTITSEEQKAINYYLDRLKDGPKDDKLIQNAIGTRFKVSGASVRKMLMDAGVIEVSCIGYDPKRQKNIYRATLLDASRVSKINEKPKPEPRMIETHWPEGFAKSHGNAFDWQVYAKGLFSKAELAAMQQKIKANPHFTQDSVHVYSRA